MEQQSDSIAIVCCYAREDENLFSVLYKHLSLLQREKKIRVWHTGDISPGTEPQQEIKKHLSGANLILLLISPDSLYSYECEMEHAIARYEQNEARVIPIILRPVAWPPVDNNTFERLQALPKGAKPLTMWENADAAWKDVIEGISRVVNELLSSNPFGLLTSDKNGTLDERKGPLFIGPSPFPQPTLSSDTCSPSKAFCDLFEGVMDLIQAALGGIENAERLFQPSYKASDAVKRRSALDYLEKVLLSLDQLEDCLETTPLPAKSNRHILRDQIHKLIEQTQVLYGWVGTRNSAYQCIRDQIEIVKQAFAGLSGLVGGDSTR